MAAVMPTGAKGCGTRSRPRSKSRNLGPLVRVNQAGCLDQCELGPTVVIYPQAIWYGGVRVEDVGRIVDETICGGRVIDDLKIPSEMLNTKGKRPTSLGDPVM